MMWISPELPMDYTRDYLGKTNADIAAKEVINTNVRAVSPSYPFEKSLFKSYLATDSRFFPIIHTPNSNNRFK
jgi:hypothetical protein